MPYCCPCCCRLHPLFDLLSLLLVRAPPATLPELATQDIGAIQPSSSQRRLARFLQNSLAIQHRHEAGHVVDNATELSFAFMHGLLRSLALGHLHFELHCGATPLRNVREQDSNVPLLGGVDSECENIEPSIVERAGVTLET